MQEIQTDFLSSDREMVKGFVVHLPGLQYWFSKAVGTERELHFFTMPLLLLRQAEGMNSQNLLASGRLSALFIWNQMLDFENEYLMIRLLKAMLSEEWCTTQLLRGQWSTDLECKQWGYHNRERAPLFWDQNHTASQKVAIRDTVVVTRYENSALLGKRSSLTEPTLPVTNTNLSFCIAR
jgi:hypothetical protein